MTPGAWPVWTPRGLIARIFVVDHYTLLHTKNMSSGPHGFRQEDFLCFPIISLWELMTPRVWPVWTPRGLIARIFVVDHYTLLHTKYISSGPHGFRQEDFLSFPIISLWELMTPRMWPMDPRGMVGRIYVGYHLTSLHT